MTSAPYYKLKQIESCYTLWEKVNRKSQMEQERNSWEKRWSVVDRFFQKPRNQTQVAQVYPSGMRIRPQFPDLIAFFSGWSMEFWKKQHLEFKCNSVMDLWHIFFYITTGSGCRGISRTNFSNLTFRRDANIGSSSSSSSVSTRWAGSFTVL